MRSRWRHRWRVVGVGLLLGMAGLEAASGAGPTPVIEDDPYHPGYYKPFRCLSIDRTARGGHKRAEIRNNCGFTVEAYWRDTSRTGSSWTIPAGEWHPLFLEPRGEVLGCLRNHYLDPALKLCKRDGATPQAEADGLAEEPVATPPHGSNPPQADTDALLAAALDNANREVARQRELRQADRWNAEQALREAAQASSKKLDALPSTFGVLAGAGLQAGLAYAESEQRKDQARIQLEGYGDTGCRSDPAIQNRMQLHLQTCDARRAAAQSVCEVARATRDCFAELEAMAAGCPSIVSEARHYRQQAERQVAEACISP